MKKQLLGLGLAVLGVMAIAACSSSDSSGVNYDGKLVMGPTGVELQGFYSSWEKGVPLPGK